MTLVCIRIESMIATMKLQLYQFPQVVMIKGKGHFASSWGDRKRVKSYMSEDGNRGELMRSMLTDAHLVCSLHIQEQTKQSRHDHG